MMQSFLFGTLSVKFALGNEWSLLIGSWGNQSEMATLTLYVWCTGLLFTNISTTVSTWYERKWSHYEFTSQLCCNLQWTYLMLNSLVQNDYSLEASFWFLCFVEDEEKFGIWRHFFFDTTLMIQFLKTLLGWQKTPFSKLKLNVSMTTHLEQRPMLVWQVPMLSRLRFGKFSSNKFNMNTVSEIQKNILNNPTPSYHKTCPGSHLASRLRYYDKLWYNIPLLHFFLSDVPLLKLSC